MSKKKKKSDDRPTFDPTRARGAEGWSLFALTNENSNSDSATKNTSRRGTRDRSHAKQSTAQSNATTQRPLTVSEITDRIGRVLTDHLPSKVRVIGEVSNLSKRNHWYFSLKDENAVISCVAWASKARTFGFEVENGMEVVTIGSVQFYAPQGRCQLYVDRLEPVGAGALEMQFRALCDELRREGYFDPARKKSTPMFPRRVAVITSEKGAALHDVLDTMRRRWPAIDVLLIDVRVQGDDAAGDVVRALEWVTRHHSKRKIDAVILTRGGGSIEDLWAFNERMVADALLDFPIATIAAIGHETDTTIAELVADVRCATPTQAAMTIAPDRNELAVQLDHLQRRLGAQVEHSFRWNVQRLQSTRSILTRPDELLAAIRERSEAAQRHLSHAVQQQLATTRRQCDRLAVAIERIRPIRLAARRERDLSLAKYRLVGALAHRLERESSHIRDMMTVLDDRVSTQHGLRLARFERARAVFESLDHRHVLARGFSVTRRAEDGRIITSERDANAGEQIETVLADGIIESEVTGSSRIKNTGQAGRSSRQNPSKSKSVDERDQMGLF